MGVNLAITHARRELGRRPREARAERMNACTTETPVHDSRVVAAVRTLSPRDRALIVLFYFEDRPLVEVAEILDMSIGAAKVALHRARARMGDLLRRSARRTRLRRGAYLVAAVVIVVVAGAGVVMLPREGSSPSPVAPVQPHGAYERSVTAGRWQGDCALTLDEGRVLRLVAPTGVSSEEAPTDGASYRLTAEYYPHWSPDGTWLTYHRELPQPDGSVQSQFDAGLSARGTALVTYKFENGVWTQFAGPTSEQLSHGSDGTLRYEEGHRLVLSESCCGDSVLSWSWDGTRLRMSLRSGDIAPLPTTALPRGAVQSAR